MFILTQKKCTKCGEEKSVSEFRKDKKQKSGIRCRCISCEREQGKLYRIANREKTIESQKKWRLENPERRKQYRLDNSEKITEYQKLYRAGHHKQKAKWEKQWCIDNWGKVRLKEYKSSSLRRGHEWLLTDKQALELFYQPCHYCGGVGRGIDRVDNSIGYVLENCVPCCKWCNRMKGTMSYRAFLDTVMKIVVHQKTTESETA